MPYREYYLGTGDYSKHIREQYLEHVAKMFTLLGEDPIGSADLDVTDVTTSADLGLTVSDELRSVVGSDSLGGG